MESKSRQHARRGRAWALALAALALLPGGTCHFAFRSDHDDCDPKDPPAEHDPCGEAAPGAGDLAITSFRAAFSPAPWTHPLRELTALRGPPAAPLRAGEAALALFAGRVLEANPLLFRLPPSAGRLALVDAEIGPGGARARFAQVRGDPERAIEGAAVLLEFDAAGRLARVENATFPYAPLLPPLGPRAWDTR